MPVDLSTGSRCIAKGSRMWYIFCAATIKQRRVNRMKIKLLLLLLMAICPLAACAEPVPPRITEACGDNDFVWTLGFEDYMEIHNPGPEELFLGDYSLRVKKNAVQLPSVTLEPGEFYVLVCDGEEAPKLSKSGFTASILDKNGQAVDTVTVPEHRNRVWYRDGELSSEPSPGYANAPAGQAAWHQDSRSGLIISEAVSANYTARRGQKRGRDALELYNAGNEPVLLSDYCLSDDRDNPTLYPLPQKALRAGECIVIECSNATTGFGLSAKGETVYLATADGEIIDALNLPALPLDTSYGRGESGAAGYLPQVSLGKPNPEEPLGSMAKAPEMTVTASGGHEESFLVTITGEAPIHYTLDGSTPDATSPRLSGAITVSGNTTLRAVSLPADKLPSRVTTQVYRFDTADHTLPCLFVTVDSAVMTDERNGLLLNTEDKSLEVPAHATFLTPEGALLFSEDCGLAIAGQTSRKRQSRGWKLLFGAKYGCDGLDVALFDDPALTGFDSLVLRLGSANQPIHDVLGAALGEGFMPDVLYQRYRPVNLFIGEKYYGVYYLREHVNEQFVAAHLGGSEDQVDIVQGVGNVQAGSGDDLAALMDFCRKADLSVQENYDYVASQVNVDSFIDYFIWRPFIGDTDHPNIRYVRVRDAADPRWHLVIYDMDWAFQNKSVNMSTYTYAAYDTDKHNNVIITALLKNPGFRDRFLQRMSQLMATAFAPERTHALLDTLAAQVRPDMDLHQARWGSTVGAWEKVVRGIHDFLGEGRTDRRTVILRETQRYFKLSDGQMAELFPGMPTK